MVFLVSIQIMWAAVQMTKIIVTHLSFFYFLVAANTVEPESHLPYLVCNRFNFDPKAGEFFWVSSSFF